jgi:DNA-binding SARP family transcriptional activator/tetratricopeptide (TPR) repeat protein/TolB-like protein
LRLNTLGGIRVVADGRSVTGAAAQPRRLAVLALLARAGRPGITREKILALLWPEEPEERARRSLNQAVYSLRRELGGEDALLGAKDLRLNLDRIEVDTIEFDDALKEGDFERAIELYAGPFLDGFFVPRAAEFERWVEVERAALALEYARALERTAAAAGMHGDHGAAAELWRRLAATDPLNGRVALSVMTALVAAGDVNGALQHARLHEALVDQELGLPPDREIAAFARELRARPATDVPVTQPIAISDEPVVASPVAAASVNPSTTNGEAPVEHERVEIVDASRGALAPATPQQHRWRWMPAAVVAAVAIFSTVAYLLSRGRSDSRLSGGPVVAVGSINDYASPDSIGIGRALRDMLATNLARSRDLTVVSSSRLLEVERQMNGGGASAPGTIVPVARQAGATALVDGSLYRKAADTLRLDLRITSLRNGTVLRAYTVSGRDPFDLADSATARLAEYLGSTAPRGTVADATTRSVSAYRLYEEGLRSYYLGDMASAERMFDAALLQDSGFAMAAYYFALTSHTTRAEFIRRLRRAVSLAGRASDRERLIIQGGWAERNNLRSLRPIGETLATRYPTEVEGHYYLGRALVNGGSFLESIAPLRRVEVMDSLSLRGKTGRCAACESLQQQVVAYMLADSMAAAERVARRWIAARPNDWVARLVLGRILSVVNRVDEAMAAFRVSDSLDVLGRAWEPMVSLLTREGDFARADEILRREIAKGPGEGEAGPVNVNEARWFLAISLRYQGRLEEALGEATAFRRGGGGREHIPPGAVELAALQEAQVLRELGRYRESAALFDSISRFTVAGADSAAIQSGRVWSLTHEAGALAAGGDTARLETLADTIEAYGSGSNLARDSRIHHHVRGLLLAARGDDSMAVAEFRRAVFSATAGYTRTNVEMARALLRLGRYAEAISVLEPALRGSLEASNLYVTYPEIRLLLAQAYAGAGERDRADRELDWVRRAWIKADPYVRPQLDLATHVVEAIGRQRVRR